MSSTIACELDQRRDVGERQVGLTTADQALDVGDDRLVAQLHVDVGPSRAEEGERRWQQPGAGGLKRADPQHAGVACGHRVEVGLGRSQSGDDVAGVVEQDLAGLRERHRSRTARAFDEAMTDGFLERRDLLRDRALRVAETGGGLENEPVWATASRAIRWRTSTPTGRSYSEMDFSIYIYFPY